LTKQFEHFKPCNLENFAQQVGDQAEKPYNQWQINRR